MRRLEIIIILLLIPLARPILANRDLDALRRKALAQPRALDDAWEALSAVHGEDLAEARREHGGLAGVDAGHGDAACVGAAGWRGGDADVHE